MTARTEAVTTGEPEVTERKHRKRLSEGARAERRLGFLLCAPAVIVMLAVAAFPIVYAIWLSLQRYDLRFPERRQVHRLLPTTPRCCTTQYWWPRFVVTA